MKISSLRDAKSSLQLNTIKITFFLTAVKYVQGTEWLKEKPEGGHCGHRSWPSLYRGCMVWANLHIHRSGHPVHAGVPEEQWTWQGFTANQGMQVTLLLLSEMVKGNPCLIVTLSWWGTDHYRRDIEIFCTHPCQLFTTPEIPDFRTCVSKV